VLGLDAPQAGYRIVTDQFAFLYHVGPLSATIQLELPFEAYGYRYDSQARTVELLHISHVAVTLARREYILLERDRWTWPWLV
jgi:hypothetical protein